MMMQRRRARSHGSSRSKSYFAKRTDGDGGSRPSRRPARAESLIKKSPSSASSAASVPEAYGGTEMGYLTMSVLTEELSTASLVAGSLITRSEILTRALLEGGTEAQRQTGCRSIANGEAAGSHLR